MARRSSRYVRIKKPLKSDMNVVPYIDVMLVLLVIFMVTAPMMTSGLQIDLPQASADPIVSKETAAIVSLDKNGQYFLKYKDYNTQQAISLTELTTVLTQAQSENQQLSVIIEGDKTRAYGEVIALMNSLQSAGLTQVGLLTEPLN